MLNDLWFRTNPGEWNFSVAVNWYKWNKKCWVTTDCWRMPSLCLPVHLSVCMSVRCVRSTCNMPSVATKPPPTPAPLFRYDVSIISYFIEGPTRDERDDTKGTRHNNALPVVQISLARLSVCHLYTSIGQRCWVLSSIIVNWGDMYTPVSCKDVHAQFWCFLKWIFQK